MSWYLRQVRKLLRDYCARLALFSSTINSLSQSGKDAKAMRRFYFYAVFATILLAFSANASFAQGRRAQEFRSRVMTPSSSIEKPEDVGVRAHTNLRILVPKGGNFGMAEQPNELPPFLGLFFETPASIACVYRLVHTHGFACDPDTTTQNPSGGGGAIAVVDAFDNPTAAADLATFDAQFGLPAANFTVVFSGGTQPKADPTGGWEIEESLDVQWAHAMAPNAKIFLVEAPSSKFVDLFTA